MLGLPWLRPFFELVRIFSAVVFGVDYSLLYTGEKTLFVSGLG